MSKKIDVFDGERASQVEQTLLQVIRILSAFTIEEQREILVTVAHLLEIDMSEE